MSIVRAEQAWYFDGNSASRVPAAVTLNGEEAVEIRVEGREAVVWLRGTYRTERREKEVLFLRIPDTGESVLISDPVFAALSNRMSRFEAGPVVFGLFGILAVLTAGVYFSVGPLTAALAELVPEPVESAIGAAVVRQMAPEEARLRSAAVEEVVERSVRRIAGAEHRYQVVLSKSPEVNAFAMPGGWIVVNCGLIEVLGSADEFSAVLAHEMTHVQERHSMRNLIRSAGARLLISAIFGGGDAALDFAVTAGSLGYMRADEEAADRGAHRMLRNARVNPAALASAFRTLEREAPEMPGALRYLSSHPPIQERQRLAREAAAGWVGAWEAVASAEEWGRVVAGCGCE